MNYNTNHKPPCNGFDLYPTLGGCQEQLKTTGSKVQVWDNVTLISSGSSQISPQPLPIQNPLPGCASTPQCNPACSPFDPTTLVACANTQIGYNCFFLHTGSYYDFSRCIDIGFRNLQFFKAWHGQFGPMSTFWKVDLGIPDYMSDYLCDCQIRNPIYTPDNTKYLTKQASSTVHVYNGASLNNYASASLQSSVGRYTGNNNIDNCGSGDSYNDTGSYLKAQNLNGYIDMNQKNLLGLFCADVGDTPGFSTATGGATHWDVTFTGSNGTTFEFILDLNGGTYTRKGWGFIDCTQTSWIQLSTETWTLTGTTINYSFVGEISGGCPPNPNTNTVYAMAGSFSNAYTSDQVQDDFWAARAYWDYGNDIEYCGWRRDGYVTVAPLINYGESPLAVSPSFGNCSSSSVNTYNGQISGSPVTFITSGSMGVPAGVYDFNHVNWKECFDSVNMVYTWYEYSTVAKSGFNIAGNTIDASMPKTAPQWTDNYHSTLYSDGAWLNFDANTNVLYGQDFAEVVIPMPSLSPCRPCGEDRYTYSQPDVRCISTFNTSSKTINLDTSSATGTYVNGDPVLICGTNYSGSGLDGGWRISAGSGYSFTLGPQLFSASAYTPPNNWCGLGRVGKMRWYDSASAICGVISCSAIVSGPGNKVTCSLKEVSYLHDNDVVTIGNAGSINGNHTCSVINSQTIVLNDTASGINVVGGTITTPTSCNDYWNDFANKGTVTVQNWLYSYRDVPEVKQYSSSLIGCSYSSGSIPIPRTVQAANGLDQNVNGFTCNDLCVHKSPCNTSVVYISHVTQSFKNAVRFDIPYFSCLDANYGNRWAAKTNQWMQDPYTVGQTPHEPCCSPSNSGSECTYTFHQDDGTCLSPVIGGGGTITTDYYPLLPYLEAQCALSASSPALPANIFIGCANYAALQTASYSGAPICNAPSAVGEQPGGVALPNIPFEPWITFLNAMTCACNSGRWSTVYTKEGFACIQLLEFGV